METKKDSFIKDLFVVGVGNVFVLVSSVLVGLVVPKLMGVANYGYYQIFTLYMTYTALLHGGYIDGILLIHGGQSYDEINKTQFLFNTKFFVVFQVILSAIIVFTAAVFMQGIYSYIFVMVGIDTFVTNITKYFQHVSQCTMRFKEWSLRRIILAILKIVLVVTLVIINRAGHLTSVSCKLFILAIVVIDSVLLIWYLYTYREISFGNSPSLLSNWKEALKYFKCGIALTVAYEISSLIFSLDRQFVSVFFDIDIYGIYSFAYRIVSMVTIVVGAASTVLFPTLKRKSKEQVLCSFDNNMALLSLVVFASLIGYYPLCKFIKFYLPDYSGALIYFRILFPGIALTSCISSIIFNYYKVLDKNVLYFGICLCVLVFSVASNYGIYLILGTPESFSIASIITLIIWYILAEVYLVKKYSVRWIKNFIYIITIMAAFYLCTETHDESFLGIALYVFLYISISFCFYWNLLKTQVLQIFHSKKH